MSGHEDMTSQRVQGQTIFARNGGLLHALEGDINHDETSFNHFKSELTSLTPPKCLLTFWSTSAQGNVKIRSVT